MNGYTKGARNEIFALRPAPIQVRFLFDFFATCALLIVAGGIITGQRCTVHAFLPLQDILVFCSERSKLHRCFSAGQLKEVVIGF